MPAAVIFSVINPSVTMIYQSNHSMLQINIITRHFLWFTFSETNFSQENISASSHLCQRCSLTSPSSLKRQSLCSHCFLSSSEFYVTAAFCRLVSGSLFCLSFLFYLFFQIYTEDKCFILLLQTKFFYHFVISS